MVSPVTPCCYHPRRCSGGTCWLIFALQLASSSWLVAGFAIPQRQLPARRSLEGFPVILQAAQRMDDEADYVPVRRRRRQRPYYDEEEEDVYAEGSAYWNDDATADPADPDDFYDENIDFDEEEMDAALDYLEDMMGDWEEDPDYHLLSNVVLPNPLLDNMDPDGAWERAPELLRDVRFWFDLGIFILLLDFLALLGADNPLPWYTG